VLKSELVDRFGPDRAQDIIDQFKYRPIRHFPGRVRRDPLERCRELLNPLGYTVASDADIKQQLDEAEERGRRGPRAPPRAPSRRRRGLPPEFEGLPEEEKGAEERRAEEREVAEDERQVEQDIIDLGEGPEEEEEAPPRRRSLAEEQPNWMALNGQQLLDLYNQLEAEGRYEDANLVMQELQLRLELVEAEEKRAEDEKKAAADRKAQEAADRAFAQTLEALERRGEQIRQRAERQRRFPRYRYEEGVLGRPATGAPRRGLGFMYEGNTKKIFMFSKQQCVCL
jgi:hypothetical protein